MRLLDLVLLCSLAAGCNNDGTPASHPLPVDPDTAATVAVDRFSDAFGHLFVRSKSAALPAADAPIDFDATAPLITHGFSPQGRPVTYYNFDVLSATPAPIYVLFAAGASSPVSGQLNVIDVVPGDAGYNDFWQVVKVTVPAGYVANTVTSYAEIVAAGYAMQPTSTGGNCPVVPAGGAARPRHTAGGGGGGGRRGKRKKCW